MGKKMCDSKRVRLLQAFATSLESVASSVRLQSGKARNRSINVVRKGGGITLDPFLVREIELLVELCERMVIVAEEALTEQAKKERMSDR